MAPPPAIEVLPENTRENANVLRAYLTLQDLAVALDPNAAEQERNRRMNQALNSLKDESGEQNERLIIGRTTIDLLHAEHGTLEQKIQGEADENLRLLFERTQEHIAARRMEAEAVVAALERQVNEERVSPQGEKTFGQQMNGISIGITDTLIPETMTKDWTDEKKRNVGLAVTVGTAAIIAVGAWLWARGRSAADEGRNARIVGGVLAGVGVGLLAFFGLKKAWDAYQNVQKATDLLAQSEEALRETRERMERAAGEERERLRQREEELREAIENLRNGESLDEEQREIIEQGAETASVWLVQKALPMQYDVAREIDPSLSSPLPLLREAREITSLAARRSVPMGFVLDCMDANPADDAPCDAFLKQVFDEDDFARLSPEELRQKRLSAHLLVGFLKKHRQAIERSEELSERGDVRALPFGEALNVFAHAPGAAEDLLSTIGPVLKDMVLKRELPDPKEALGAVQSVFKDPELYGEKMVEFVLAPLSKHSIDGGSSAEAKREFRDACKKVALFFTQGNVTVRNMESAIPATWAADGNESAMAHGVCNALRTDDRLLESVLASAFIPKNPAERNAFDQETTEALTTILRDGDLSLADAFQIYYLSQSGNGGNTLMMFKMIDLLEKHGYRELAIDRYHTAGDQLLSTAAEGGVSVAALAAKLNLSEAEERELSNMSLYLQEKVGKELEDTWTHIKTFSRHHPVVASVLGVAAIVGTYRTVVRPPLSVLAKIEWTAIRNFAAMKGNATAIEAFARARNIPIAEVENALTKVDDVFRKLIESDIGYSAPWRKWQLRREAAAAIQEAKRASSATSIVDDAADLVFHPKSGTWINRETAEALDAMSDVAPPPAATSAVTEAVESGMDAGQALAKIDAARAAGNHAEIGKLLAEHDELLKVAAANGDEAAEQVLTAAKFARRSRLMKVGSGALIGIGIAFDAYLIIQNERELAEARETNPALAATLEARRKSLIAAGGGGILLEVGMYAAGVSGGAALVLAAPVVEGAMYSEAIYDNVREWDKTSKDYLIEDRATLLTKVKEEMTNRTRASAAVHGDTTMQWLWKKVTWSRTEREKYYEEKFQQTEREINRPMRQKLYEAYFLKSAKPNLTAQEAALPEAERKKKESQSIKETVRLKSNFVSLVTHGEFDVIPPEELAKSDAYATLTLMRAEKERAGKSQSISYVSADGTEKTFDLSIFHYDGIPQGVEERQKIREALTEYRAVVQPAQIHTKAVLLNEYVAFDEKLTDVERETYRKNLRLQLRSDLLARVQHHLNKAEEYIRTSDLQMNEQDVVRMQLRTELDQRIANIEGGMERGEMNHEQFSKAILELERVSEDLVNSPRSVFDRNTSALKTALLQKPRKNDDKKLMSPERRIEGIKRSEAKKMGIHDVETALLELAA